MSELRTAIIKDTTGLSKVQAYLPSNYKAFGSWGHIIIEGYDSHGWTMHGYVLPRLASGGICAEEILGWPKELSPESR